MQVIITKNGRSRTVTVPDVDDTAWHHIDCTCDDCKLDGPTEDDLVDTYRIERGAA